ncbi:MAG TPA: right-handed parallel beta-helix repeat-containing protein [Humisphaera sp.]
MATGHVARVESLEARSLLSAYFVSPSGSDSADGLSPTTAFQSIRKVNSLDLEAGDKVLFEAGKVFTGNLLLSDFDSGTAAAPVKVSSYTLKADGTVAEGGARATIDAGGSYGILGLNVAGVEVSDLVVKGSGTQAPQSTSGIEFRNTLTTATGGDVDLEYVRIRNVDVGYFGDVGIELTGGAAKSGFKDVRIEWVDVHDNTNAGIASLGLFNAAATGYAHQDVYVGHAKVYNNKGYAGSANHSGDGIVLSDAQGVTIEYSEAFNNGENNTHVGGPVGIWVWDVDRALIQYNESHHNRTNSTADGGGFDLDGGVTNSVVQYNYSHDNDGAGYGIYQFQGARAFRNNHVRYNLSVDDGRKNSYGAFDFWNGNGTNGIQDTYVYNNTVYVSPSTTTKVTYDRKGNPVTSTVTVGDPRAVRFISGTVNCAVLNNNFYSAGGAMLAQIDAKQTNLRMNGNNWFAAGAFSLKVFAKVYTSFSGYQATGYDLNGSSINPGFTTAGSKPTVGWINLVAPSATVASPWGGVLGGYKPTNAALQNRAIAEVWTYTGGITAATTDFYGNALPGSGKDVGLGEF